MNQSKKPLYTLLATLLFLVVLNVFNQFFYARFDLTLDKRYTLSESTKKIIDDIQEPLFFDVFLEGNFPGSIKKLQQETRQLLEEFEAQNSNINFQFVNPLADVENPDEIINAFYDRGMTPINITVEDRGKQSQEMIFPWAYAYSGKQSTKIGLLKNRLGATAEEKVISSVQHLEYALAKAIKTVTNEKSKKIAVLKGNQELEDSYIGDFALELRENYFIAPFTLDSVAQHPKETLDMLAEFDLALMAKPKERFTDAEKLVLDQFVMRGGKMIWLVETVNIEMDSLYNAYGSTLAFPIDLNLNDLFFKYGFRINPSMIKDVMATPISLATGEEGSQKQYAQYPWLYSPMIYPDINHPIVANMDGVKLEFSNPIDTLKNGIKKTVLLHASAYSKTVGTPAEVNLKMVNERPDKNEFLVPGNFPVAVLLEGNFSSVYKNRVLPFTIDKPITESPNNKMIVVSDGDVIKNQLNQNGKPMELGYDKWTESYYANKEFLLNAVNYLLDDTGLINLRTKEVSLPLLDKDKVYEDYNQIQILTVGLPILMIMLFGIIFIYIRKKIYSV
uniref:gliding motility-associated ABC transporter substrate-binding protein GldG n=1 Tax=Flavobacterium sp. TaxID=239 RepID=UPI00404B4E78